MRVVLRPQRRHPFGITPTGIGYSNPVRGRRVAAATQPGGIRYLRCRLRTGSPRTSIYRSCNCPTVICSNAATSFDGNCREFIVDALVARPLFMPFVRSMSAIRMKRGTW